MGGQVNELQKWKNFHDAGVCVCVRELGLIVYVFGRFCICQSG